MNEKKAKQKVKDYYDQEAGDYIKQCREPYARYSANRVRTEFIDAVPASGSNEKEYNRRFGIVSDY